MTGLSWSVDAYPAGLAEDPAFVHRSDVLVIGAGAAGLMAAWSAARRGSVRVAVVTKQDPLASNTAYAQGGIAVAIGQGDSPELHEADTLAVTGGIADPEAVRVLTREGPERLRDLLELGMPFDRTDGQLALGLEAGHSRRRVLHVHDGTGLALERTLLRAALRQPHISWYSGLHVAALAKSEGVCVGAWAVDAQGRTHLFLSAATILAAGGIGALYSPTSNPRGAIGEGIAMAYRAGASVADMEFIQFHPTVLMTPAGGFLISEAVRGEGGRLVSTRGRFMSAYDRRGELAPRDVVARAIFREMVETGMSHVWLDVRHLGDRFVARFPTIARRCREVGIDPARDLIPVRPAAHYTMGGVRTDLWGATDLPGLYACGECACTGVHGANRLASNSLLECLVFGHRVAVAALEATSGRLVRTAEPPVASSAVAWPEERWEDLRQEMMARAGLERSREPLRALLDWLEAGSRRDGVGASPLAVACQQAVVAAQLVVRAALARTESRGAHFRVDFPEPEELWRGHLVWRNGEEPRLEFPLHGPTGLEAGAIAGGCLKEVAC